MIQTMFFFSPLCKVSFTAILLFTLCIYLLIYVCNVVYPVPVAPDGVRDVSEGAERIRWDCILKFALADYCQMRAIFIVLVHPFTFRSFAHCLCLQQCVERYRQIDFTAISCHRTYCVFRQISYLEKALQCNYVETGLHWVSKCIRHGLLMLQCVCVCDTETDRRYQHWEGPGWWRFCSKIGYVTRSGIKETSYEFSGCSSLNIYCKIMSFRVGISCSRSTVHLAIHRFSITV